jgi:hypothetical protein
VQNEFVIGEVVLKLIIKRLVVDLANKTVDNNVFIMLNAKNEDGTYIVSASSDHDDI